MSLFEYAAGFALVAYGLALYRLIRTQRRQRTPSKRRRHAS